jgi:hypothetical protein
VRIFFYCWSFPYVDYFFNLCVRALVGAIQMKDFSAKPPIRRGSSNLGPTKRLSVTSMPQNEPPTITEVSKIGDVTPMQANPMIQQRPSRRVSVRDAVVEENIMHNQKRSATNEVTSRVLEVTKSQKLIAGDYSLSHFR